MAKASNIVQPDHWKPAKPVRRKLNLRTPLGKLNNTSIEVRHDEDPKRTLLDALGPLPPGIVQGTRILVAIYVPPMVAQTAGGIHLPDSLKEEDVNEYCWQGKVGLIVAMGEGAYVDDDAHTFGSKNKLHDWVWFMPSEGQGCYVNQVFCRKFNGEAFLSGNLPHPDLIW